MSFTLLDAILLLGMAQGFFLAFFLLHKRGSLFAIRFLAALMLLDSLILLHLMLWDNGFFLRHPRYYFILASLPLLAGPLLFLFVKHLINGARSFQRSEWLHLLPFILHQLYSLRHVFESHEKLHSFIRSTSHETIPAEIEWFNWLSTFQGLAYLFAAIVLLRRFARELPSVFSTVNRIRLDWLRFLTYLATGAWLTYLIENTFALAGFPPFDNFYLPSFMLVILVYAMGYMALARTEIFADREIVESMRGLPEMSGWQATNGGGGHAEAERKYGKSGLSPEKAVAYLECLLKFMAEKAPYTNSRLTLPQLSKMLAISPHNLSEIINTHLQQNFFDFVNGYRVEKVKRDLADPRKQHLTLLALAEEAGFNSKSSFNAIFKKHTGVTPSEYRKRQAPRQND